MNPPDPHELAALKAKGIMQEKNRSTYTLRLRVVGGCFESRQLEALGRLAAKYGKGYVHLTTRQGIELPHVPYENLEPLLSELEAAGIQMGFTGKRVRGITACPGSFCKFGQIDTQALARSLDARVGGRGNLPHKFKIAVTGCPNGCAKPIENDLGIMGLARGYRLFVGGRMGRKPRWADSLPVQVAEEDSLLNLVERIIDWYAAHGRDKERFGETLDRLGLDRLLADMGMNGKPDAASPEPSR